MALTTYGEAVTDVLMILNEADARLARGRDAGYARGDGYWSVVQVQARRALDAACATVGCDDLRELAREAIGHAPSVSDGLAGAWADGWFGSSEPQRSTRAGAHRGVRGYVDAARWTITLNEEVS